MTVLDVMEEIEEAIDDAARRQRELDAAIVTKMANEPGLTKAQREALITAADAIRCDEFDAALGNPGPPREF